MEKMKQQQAGGITKAEAKQDYKYLDDKTLYSSE
jgi:hypothetical protein